LVINKDVIINNKNVKYWLCECDCGNKKLIGEKHLLSGGTKSCGCLQYESKTKIHFSKRNAELEKFLPYLSATKWRHKPADVSLEDLKNVWDSQNGLCPFTGVVLKLIKGKDNYKTLENRGIYIASLDRIDSNIGYVKGNIQFVSMMINYAKHKFSDNDVIEFCKIICNHWKHKI